MDPGETKGAAISEALHCIPNFGTKARKEEKDQEEGVPG